MNAAHRQNNNVLIGYNRITCKMSAQCHLVHIKVVKLKYANYKLNDLFLAFLLFISAVDEEKKSDCCETVDILKYFISFYLEATTLLDQGLLIIKPSR